MSLSVQVNEQPGTARRLDSGDSAANGGVVLVVDGGGSRDAQRSLAHLPIRVHLQPRNTRVNTTAAKRRQ